MSFDAGDIVKTEKLSKIDARGVRSEVPKEESTKVFNYLNTLLGKLTEEDEDIEYVEESILRNSALK